VSVGEWGGERGRVGRKGARRQAAWLEAGGNSFPSSSPPPLTTAPSTPLSMHASHTTMHAFHARTRRRHGLSSMHARRARWHSKPVAAANIAENLTPMSDRYWVAEECAMRVAEGAEQQRVLLEYCLNEAAMMTWSQQGVSDS
jgi:hypothetical protein